MTRRRVKHAHRGGNEETVVERRAPEGRLKIK